MRVLDLFSGIGGFSLGLERAGLTTVAFCERDPACHKVLRKHWPDIPIFNNIETLDISEVPKFEVVCGGFPCQDISIAGKGAGIDGTRSGLWWEFHRIIRESTPKWVIIENVSALRYRGLDRVLWSLSEIGYDAEWHCIPASAVGAPHQRDRVWIVAYPHGKWQHPLLNESCLQRGQASSSSGKVHTSDKDGRNGWSSKWLPEPSVDRVVDGISIRMDRIKQLGNSLVPQIPELIGHVIIETQK